MYRDVRLTKPATARSVLCRVQISWTVQLEIRPLEDGHLEDTMKSLKFFSRPTINLPKEAKQYIDELQFRKKRMMDWASFVKDVDTATVPLEHGAWTDGVPAKEMHRELYTALVDDAEEQFNQCIVRLLQIKPFKLSAFSKRKRSLDLVSVDDNDARKVFRDH